ncbi:MAG TPA: fused MFS/spermidine synthase [Candidatus Nanoarchaeia archaeon]|nr:fused MFS/spermidine synthase [Candidatus Nanoarchaeia archaeon]
MNKKILLIAFTISGTTALIYEIVWSRPLQLIFGSTIYAVSTILTTFFVGFALGSYLFRNIADNVKKPLALFGLIQLGIGLYGLMILGLFKALTPIYLALESSGFQSAQSVLLFLVLIIPATLFGATWPVINRAYVKIERRGEDFGRLYSFNSFGSFLGPILAGLVLIPWWGITNTSLFAASINIILGLLTLIYSKKSEKNGGEKSGEWRF